jgi:hypothetical protein
MDKRELQLKISKAIGAVFDEVTDPSFLGVSFVIGVYVADDVTAMSGGVVVRDEIDEESFSKLTREYFRRMRDDDSMVDCGITQKEKSRAN